MNRFERRLRRLEKGGEPDQVFIWGNYPIGLEDRYREITETVARERGYEPPFDFTSSSCTNLQGGEDDIKLIFIGTHAEFDALLRKIGEERRLVTDRD